MNQGLVKSIIEVIRNTSIQLAQEGTIDNYMMGVLSGISLMRSHSELALAINELYRPLDLHLQQVAIMDQMIAGFEEVYICEDCQGSHGGDSPSRSCLPH